MTNTSFLTRVRAAHALSIAMTEGTQPRKADLTVLGIPSNFAKRFKR